MTPAPPVRADPSQKHAELAKRLAAKEAARQRQMRAFMASARRPLKPKAACQP